MFSVDVLTLFPGIVTSYASESILGRAHQAQLIQVSAHDIRSFAPGKHRVCDDAPFGGGAGMVMKVEPLAIAIKDARSRHPDAPVILMSPRGKIFLQSDARRWASDHASSGMIFVCGRYEGVDERVVREVDQEFSIGDFVLTGGELAALSMIDSTVRLLPGVLGNAGSSADETFEEGLLEYPHYTRPAEFQGIAVPSVLQSGNHAQIRRWRRWQSLQLTRDRRPDLFMRLSLSEEDRKLLGLSESEL